MARRQTSTVSFYNLSQYEPDCQNNKYLKALVLSYFSLTREMDILDALKKIEEEDNWNDLYEEYKRYHAGEDIQIDSGKQDLFDPSLMETMTKDNQTV